MNEFFICCITIMTFMFTDYCTDGELKYNVGWCYIATLAFIELISVLYVVKCATNSIMLVIVKVYRIINHKLSPNKVPEQVQDQVTKVEVEVNIFDLNNE